MMSLSEVACTVVHYLIVHGSELSFCNGISIECLIGSVMVLFTYTVLRYGLRVCSQFNITLGCCLRLCSRVYTVLSCGHSSVSWHGAVWWCVLIVHGVGLWAQSMWVTWWWAVSSVVCVNILLSYGLKWYMVLDLKYTSELYGAERWTSVWVTWWRVFSSE